MARCLSESLIRYQNEEEAAIMRLGHDMDESGKELLRELYTPTKITNEDLSRIYTPAEIRHLCLRTKVRVNMTLFNCVWDAKQRLDKKGRLANRSQRFVDAMLIKAVTKKMVFPYTSEEIAKCNYIRQCKLKKENNRRLDVWHFECSQASIPECNSTDSFLPGQIHIENDNIPEMAADVEIWSGIDTQSETSPNASIGSLTHMEWRARAFQINTESMTIDSENLQQTESQPLDIESPGTQPPVLSSENYDLFNTQVPATSTQTQCSDNFL